MTTEITNRLLTLDGQLREHNEGEWSGTDTKYSAFNDAGVECEVGEFLYGLVRVTKPQNILETGTHWGIGASYMGMGLLDNGFGYLDTLEFLPEAHQVAQSRINRLGLSHIVTCHLEDAGRFVPAHNYDLILLDTEPQTRFSELERYEPFLNPGGFIFIHDLHRHMHQIPNSEHGFAWPFGPIPEKMWQLIKKGELARFHFGTPRGLTGFYKKHPDDFNFEEGYNEQRPKV